MAVFAILWPERGGIPAAIHATLGSDGTLTVKRPDGKSDAITVTDITLTLR